MRENQSNGSPAKVPHRGKTRRRCLKCGKEFNSEWIGNRLCSGCNSANQSVYIPTPCNEGLAMPPLMIRDTFE